MPVAAFTVNYACPFKYLTRESEIEQVPIYTSRGGNVPQNSSKIVIVLRSIHRVEKKHIKIVKTTDMFKYIFVIIGFLYMFCETLIEFSVFLCEFLRET